MSRHLIAAVPIRAGQSLTCYEVLGEIDGRWTFAVGPIEGTDRDYASGPLGFAAKSYRPGDEVDFTRDRPVAESPPA